jgi:hypothetical protein
MALPTYQSKMQEFQLLQTSWTAQLNPLLAKPLSSANILKGIDLINGATVVNHLLGRKMQGWMISDINGAATIYRSAPLNDLTLTLTSSAACTVDLVVF